ncbi:CBM35 domain-containing protein [Curtobacterium sp. 'Ferrero']|uniref:CBM35 domain-containing protein n=1 Tax=Curtobacterium sp. 'Ferrero' TaxID=2033654 RepID=UPI0020D05CF3|nr:CBM35 domain-containing protein [Curtobacterium sp. 'Ferrero']
MTRPSRSRRRCAVPLLSIVTAAAMSVVGLAPTAHAATTDHLAVAFDQTTGAVRGGAGGTLYGLGDPGNPTQALIDGAHITNTSQKPPGGAQHPTGDALRVEPSFFAGAGQDEYVYMQDQYPDFPYNGGKRPGDANNDGVWDYLPIVKQEAETIATQSAHPKQYVFIPFNEPDLDWYTNWSNDKAQFLSDWSAVYTTIQQVWTAHGLGHARIGAMGDGSFHSDRTTDFLTYAKAQGQLPDVTIWHELNPGSLANFRGNTSTYRGILSKLGLPSIPVDITEYGNPRDMGVPGQLVQWISMFEDQKVDAQTAYWNYAGNLNDNSSRTNSANGAWWLYKWYGDLTGTTATVTPPQANTTDTLQGVASIDTTAKKATVLLGGGSNDVSVDLSGLSSSVFGTSVDVTVRADRLNGKEGLSQQPPVIVSQRATVTNGALSVTVPNSDRYAAYQVEVTPVRANRPAVDTSTVSTVEAENTTLSDATIYTQDPASVNGMASGGKDVGGFSKADSAATWTVNAPTAGTYRLTVLGGANAQPGQHALFVDNTFNQLVKYSADQSWTYRGTASVLVQLSAGSHTFSLRASKDGTTVLPGADITLDRFTVQNVTNGDTDTYPAVDARLAGGATMTYGSGTSAANGGASLSGTASATFFVSALESGYQDVSIDSVTTGASALTLAVGGRSVPLGSVSGAGSWRTTVRLWLPQGISEFRVGSPNGATVTGVTTVRGATQRAADTAAADAVRVEGESLTLAGAAKAVSLPASTGSNGDADANGVVTELGYLGNGAANTATLTRPSALGAGAYVLTVSAANAEQTSNLNYNPQVVNRFLDVSEAGGSTARGTFRNGYSWNSFWDTSIPLDLTTTNGALTLGNATAYAPDIDVVTLAKLVAGSATTSAR